MLSWEIVLVLMTLICNVNISFLIVMKLPIDGDVESNPGPTYDVTKIVKASFHQGDPMFGVSAGTQCTCNSLFSICWSKIMKVCYWKPCGLDYVLKKGDQLFKNLGLYRYLSPDELPRENQTTGTSSSERPCVLPDKEINEIGSLNTKQREIFDIVFSRATDYVKSRNKFQKLIHCIFF